MRPVHETMLSHRLERRVMGFCGDSLQGGRTTKARIATASSYTRIPQYFILRTQGHSSTNERKGFTVVQTFYLLNYILAFAGSFTIFTDHCNLLFTIPPTAVEQALDLHKGLKIIRWALYLSAFNYRIYHVTGELNTIADIMTYFMRVYRCTMTKISSLVRLRSTRCGDLVPTAPTDAKYCLTREQIRDIQYGSSVHPHEVIAEDDGLVRFNRMTWVPDDADGLKVKLLTVFHAYHVGHMVGDSTEAPFRDDFTWKVITTDAKYFVSNFLLCVLSRSGTKVPWPLTLHG